MSQPKPYGENEVRRVEDNTWQLCSQDEKAETENSEKIGPLGPQKVGLSIFAVDSGRHDRRFGRHCYNH